ncbi:MAG: ATP-binding protein, partial [bacterium]
KLIDNAVLYTDKGGISISAEIIQQENKEFIKVIVQDTGIGITMADKQTLFKIFSRGKEAEQVHPNGSGLGLYIVNEYIKIHQGKIDIESQGKNKGTSFIIVLPVMIEV